MYGDRLTPTEIESWKRKLDAMDQVEMARLYRFAPIGHPVFNSDNNLYEYFKAKFKELGGMTPEVSKEIGWDE
jgi:hypothetical protein